MKKFFSLMVLGVLFGSALNANAAGLGSAINTLNQAVGPQTGVGLSSDLPGTIATVVKAALSLVGTIFLILTIYAGILWMTAQGEDEKITKAKSIISATIIGLFITMAAYAITFFVAGRLSGTGGASSSSCGSNATEESCLNFDFCEWVVQDSKCNNNSCRVNNKDQASCEKDPAGCIWTPSNTCTHK